MKTKDWMDVIRTDELAAGDSFIHRLDPRAKIIVTSGFVVTIVSYPKNVVSALTPFIFYPVVLMATAGIPVRPVLRRILLASPFALAVAVFNPLLDREPALTVGGLTISCGWISFCSIMLRFFLTVASALIVAACTGMQRLGSGLEQLGVPRVLVAQLLFLHRYFFVLADELRRMHRSILLRSGAQQSLSLRVYAYLLGSLLLRAMDRAERIHRAMVARGFNGRIRLLRHSAFGWREWIFLCGWLAFFVAARCWNLATGLANMLEKIAV